MRILELHAERRIDRHNKVTTFFNISEDGIKDLAAEKFVFNITKDTSEQYAIQLHFIENDKGAIIPAHVNLEVTAIVK